MAQGAGTLPRCRGQTSEHTSEAFCLFCVRAVLRASTVYLRDVSAQTIVRAATLR